MAVLSMEGGNMSYGSLSCRRTVAKGEKFSLPEESISAEALTERLEGLWKTTSLMPKLKKLGISEDWLEDAIEALFYGTSYE